MLSTLNNITVSIKLSYKSKEGEPIDLSGFDVYVSLYKDYSTIKVIDRKRIDNAMAIITAKEATGLWGVYVLEISIEKGSFRDRGLEQIEFKEAI